MFWNKTSKKWWQYMYYIKYYSKSIRFTISSDFNERIFEAFVRQISPGNWALRTGSESDKFHMVSLFRWKLTFSAIWDAISDERLSVHRTFHHRLQLFTICFPVNIFWHSPRRRALYRLLGDRIFSRNLYMYKHTCIDWQLCIAPYYLLKINKQYVCFWLMFDQI